MRRLPIILLLTLLIHIFTITVVKSSNDDKLSWPPLKYTKLHFFSHTKSSPPNKTSEEVVRPKNNDLPFNFGQIKVFDEPLTIEPSISSTKLGSFQGMYIMSDQNTPAGLTSGSLVFSNELYIGSTIVLFGRYKFTSNGDDLPIVGGTSYFSYAQGVCQMRNYIDTPEAIFVLDCDVFHRPPHTSDI